MKSDLSKVKVSFLCSGEPFGSLQVGHVETVTAGTSVTRKGVPRPLGAPCSNMLTVIYCVPLCFPETSKEGV